MLLAGAEWAWLYAIPAGTQACVEQYSLLLESLASKQQSLPQTVPYTLQPVST